MTANDSDQSNEEPFVAMPRRRRLRLLGTQPTVPDPPTNIFSPLEEVHSQAPHSLHSSLPQDLQHEDSDIPSDADVEGSDEDVRHIRGPDDPPNSVIDDVVVIRATRAAFASLDGVDLKFLFRCRACVMKCPPQFMRGAYRAAMRLALEEIESGYIAGDERRTCRGWKLFLILPRMLLHRPARGGLVPKSRLLARITSFARGDWEELLIVGRDCSEAAAQVSFQASAHARSHRRPEGGPC